MLDEIFDIEQFNIFSDSQYYYFFRALNIADNNDVENYITTNKEGKITRIRTNLERFDGTPTYSPNSQISLKEMFDHIKMHQNKDTNCISLTSNANTAITYGRGNYKDRYVLIKIPKTEINQSVFEAGLYMLKEVNNQIENMKSTNKLSEEQIKLLDLIDRVNSQEQLDAIRKTLKSNTTKENNCYAGGLIKKITDSKNYLSLNERQNLEKNKTVLKLDIINKNLIKGVSNNFLIQTIGNAFSSLELIHYKEIEEEKIKELPKELMDVLAIIQQVPSNMENIEEFKQIVLNSCINSRFSGEFKYNNYDIDSKVLTMDNLYELTEGRVNYYKAITMYKKAYYYAKSRLRTHNSLKLLRQIINNSNKYDEILDYIEKNTYGIEPELTTRLSLNKVQVSESVSLNFGENEKNLFEYLFKLSIGQLNYIINNPFESLKILLNNFSNDVLDNLSINKEDWYANNIIDLIDFNRLGVVNNLSISQRNDIIKTLKENNFYTKFLYLKEQGLDDKTSVNVLLTNLIKKKETIDVEDTFSLEELEYFIGYNRVIGTKLNLRSYQKLAVDNIDETFKTRNFTSAILPTGAGKSFVALAEMYKYRNEKILYLAPNVEILNQIKKYIKNVYNPEEHIGEKDDDVIKRLFPNLILETYQMLSHDGGEKIINDHYSLIVFDELHRTGAKEWEKYVQKLVDNQGEFVKVIGITATPERDADLQNMANYWASYFGYTDEEIKSLKHLSINMDVEEAIRLGYVVNPRIINCEYSLMADGSLDNLKMSIDEIQDESLKGEKLYKYEQLRKNVINSQGIEKILYDNLKPNGKYIIFLPITKKDNEEYEDIDGNQVDKTTAEKIIKSYQTLMKQYLFSNEFFNANQEIINIYNKITNNEILSEMEIQYLTSLKEDILLLSKANIGNKSLALNTQNDLIIDEIISYMRWEKYSEIELTKRINKKMNGKVEDYSMLASYSQVKNSDNITRFNESDSSKYKFMFVMNKLNEGVHVNDIDGIIWLRPLDTNSKILYLQQLGRCIYSINPNLEYSDDKRPLVIDLVNNTLKVRLNKGNLTEERDLQELYLINEWIEKNSRLPQGNSNDVVEEEFYDSLNNIIRKYKKYNENELLLNGLSIDSKKIITKILEEGTNFGIWNINLPTIVKGEHSKKSKERKENGLLCLSPIMRNFVELSEEVVNSDNKWLRGYNFAKKYYEQYGTIKVPAHSYVIEENGKIKLVDQKDDRYNSAFPLSDWLNAQRNAKKNNGLFQNSTREKLLDDIGFSWDMRDYDKQWDYMFGLLKNYFLNYGNSNVKKRFRSFDGINEVFKDDPRYKNAPRLGLWVNTQRQQAKGNRRLSMPAERKKKLESVNFEWDSQIDYDSEWLKNYSMLLNFLSKYGHLDIPVGFKTIDGVNPSSEVNAVNLYNWLSRQKTNYRNRDKNDDELPRGAIKLIDERVSLLENIGVKWGNPNKRK